MCRCDVYSGTGQRLSLGIEQGEGPSRIRCDGEDVKSASRLARVLPLVVVSPDSQRLLTDGAELRRGIVDWALFHVEHAYGELHSRFRRSLKQRNAALKQGGPSGALQAFDAEFVELGEEIHRLRVQYLGEGLPLIEAFVRRLVQKPLELRYYAGWEDGAPLADALAVNEYRDRQRGYSNVGPHRADLKFTVDGVTAARVLSRGESKLCVVAILLSQVRFLTVVKHEKSVILLDELASELDEYSRSRVFECLDDLGCQTFLTTVSPALAEVRTNPASRMFHVEQGKVSVMV